MSSHGTPPVQFRLGTLFVLMTISAVALIPARLLLADEFFQVFLRFYLLFIGFYAILRGPLLWRRFMALRRKRDEIQSRRQQALRQAQTRAAPED